MKPYIDAVLTFEELQALFDSRDLDITTLPEDVLDNASYFGRIFARSGGLSDAVAEGLKEQNIDFDLKPCACDGIEACRMALLKKSKNVLDGELYRGHGLPGRLHWRRGLPDPRRKKQGRGGQVRPRSLRKNHCRRDLRAEVRDEEDGNVAFFSEESNKEPVLA